MARAPDVEMKRALLDEVVGYLADNGLGHMSFRRLATSLGTSPNRLVHHFGSKEELLAAALDRAIRIQIEVREGWLAGRPGMTAAEQLRRWWKWMSASPGNLALVRLGIEAATLQATHTGLPGDVRAAQVEVWRTDLQRQLIADGVPAAAAGTEASLLKATFTGLTVDLMATGQRLRLSRALEQALQQLEVRTAKLREPQSA